MLHLKKCWTKSGRFTAWVVSDYWIMSENIDLAVPFERSYWVVPGELLAGYYPGKSSRNEAQKKLGGLLNLGIRHVLNLMEPDEYDHSGNAFVPYESVMQSMAESRGLEVSFDRMPVKDMSVPTVAGMVDILNHIDEKLSANIPVYVHCWGGRGRTGTVVGCYLVRHGMADSREILGMIKKLRNNVPDSHSPSPETGAQADMVVTWGNGQ